ncbi:MAG: tetraacyldisaccharide 4'-kinase [Gammaproteobacteria bacterium]|nr:MAG: tetraacyldisaccharide 4'-kinase [Gammaproteobacteria bacterium]
MKRLEHYWYTRSPWLILLTPFSLLYSLAVRVRRLLYRIGVLPSERLPVPVIVVGNLTAGGTGKTPLTGWLAMMLKQAGYRPGIVARGYRGQAKHWPQQVRPDSDPVMVGDEAVMLARLCDSPMAVGPRRVQAARDLLKHHECDLILSDDGLQHYALQRDVDIVVIDGVRRMGNGFCLPAGPLREPASRLKKADLRVVNGLGNKDEYPMRMKAVSAHNLADDNDVRELKSFRGSSVHAVAGIGNPQRFLDFLRQAGLRVEVHLFPDHHAYTEKDVDFGDDRPVLMTAKDAVKCRDFGLRNAWYVPVTIEMGADFTERLLELLQEGTASTKISAH